MIGESNINVARLKWKIAIELETIACNTLARACMNGAIALYRENAE